MAYLTFHYLSLGGCLDIFKISFYLLEVVNLHFPKVFGLLILKKMIIKFNSHSLSQGDWFIIFILFIYLYIYLIIFYLHLRSGRFTFSKVFGLLSLKKIVTNLDLISFGQVCWFGIYILSWKSQIGHPDLNNVNEAW